MWKANVILLLATLVSSTGCVSVVSLHPLAAPHDKDAVFEPGLVGTWQEADSQDDKTQYVVTHDESGYAVIVKTGVEKSGGGKEEVKLKMQLLRVGGRYLLDIDCPSDDPAVPVHIFFKLRLEQDSAWLALMDSDWLKEQIKTSVVLRHEVLTEDHGRILLTGSPDELRSYLLPYVADDRSFEDETGLRRIN